MASAEHDALVELIVASGQRNPEQPFAPEELAAMRDAERDAVVPVPDDMDVVEETIGGVPCLAIAPRDTPTTGTILYAHGGGYLFMTARSHMPLTAALVRASGCRAVSVDYRRGPEDPYPAALDDVIAVYRALLARGDDPQEIGFGGDSAGGGLVCAASVALRDAGDALPAAAVCFSPWTDLCVTGDSVDTTDDPMLSGAGLKMMASLYLDGADPGAPTASPLYADLTGLPPMLVFAGTRECLLDDARRFVDRARDAGVDATVRAYDGAMHVWMLFGPDLPESREALAEAGDFLRAHLA